MITAQCDMLKSDSAVCSFIADQPGVTCTADPDCIQLFFVACVSDIPYIYFSIHQATCPKRPATAPALSATRPRFVMPLWSMVLFRLRAATTVWFPGHRQRPRPPRVLLGGPPRWRLSCSPCFFDVPWVFLCIAVKYKRKKKLSENTKMVYFFFYFFSFLFLLQVRIGVFFFLSRIKTFPRI